MGYKFNPFTGTFDRVSKQGVLIHQVTQNLNSGNNNINHNLGKEVVGFDVKDGGDFVATSGNVVDNNIFNINLAAGNIANASIILYYK